MDKETVALIIAQNGLGTASGLLGIKVAELEKQASAETNAAAKKKLLASAKKTAKLVKALNAANVGLAEYLKP